MASIQKVDEKVSELKQFNAPAAATEPAGDAGDEKGVEVMRQLLFGGDDDDDDFGF